MATPTNLSAVKKLSSLLSRKEKFKWLSIAGAAIIVSLLEVMTATVIVLLVQVLNNQSLGYKYIRYLGYRQSLTPNEVVMYISAGVGIIYCIKNVFSICEAFFQNYTIQRMGYDFKNKLLQKYSKSDYANYLTQNSSYRIQVVGSDAELAFTNGMIPLATVLSEGIIFTCLISMIIYLRPELALIIGGLGVITVICIVKILLPQFYHWGRDMQEASLHNKKNLMQFFHAFKEILLLNKQDSFIKAYKVHSKKKSKIQAVQIATNALPRIIIEMVFVSLFVFAIVYLCMRQANPMQMLGILGGYVYVGFRLMPGLNRVINQLNLFKATIPCIERVYSEYYSLTNKEYYVNCPQLTFNHSIDINSLNFRYLNTENDVLRNINLKINKGECIGIVGETGSGKSTLVDLILGLLSPTQGKILIDGQYPVNSHEWHRRIGYVPQSIYLTDDTIEANIAFGEKVVNYDNLNYAIKAAQLDRLISKLPLGTKTIVGERGMRLSGGERQRIAIARAIYHNPEVLIFDEATSALDNKTESILMETIHKVSQNRTVIMIAHRITTLKECDRIIVLSSGEISRIEQYSAYVQTQGVAYA